MDGPPARSPVWGFRFGPSGLITHGFLLSIYLQEMSSISLLGAFALLHTGKRDLLGLFARIFLPRPSFSSVCRKSAINFATLDFVFSSPEEILFSIYQHSMKDFLGSSLDLSTLDQGFLSSIDFSTLFGGIRPLFLEKLWWGFLKMFAPSRSFFYFFCPSAPSVLHTRPTSLRGEFPRRWHTVNPFYAFEISPRIVSRVRKFCIF